MHGASVGIVGVWVDDCGGLVVLLGERAGRVVGPIGKHQSEVRVGVEVRGDPVNLGFVC